jgi:enoyl-CoA hydratase
LDYTAYRHINAVRTGRLLTLTLANPPMNVISYDLHRELSRIFYDVQVDEEVDVVVLTGSGDTFSAGGDIPLMQKRIDHPELCYPKNAELKQIVYSLLELDRPIVCRINGDCVGFGLTLALLCDITIAVETARVGDPHVRVGYSTGDGSSVIWPQLIGFNRAREYLLTGDLFSAAHAAQIGLLNHAVPAEQLDAKVGYFVDRFVNGASKAIRWSKLSINLPLRALAHSFLDASIAYQTLTNSSADHQEAVNAFREKRKPTFTGK